MGVYGYGRNADVSGANLHLSSAKSLLKTIDANFGTLVFCRRYLERLGVKNYHLGVSDSEIRVVLEDTEDWVDEKAYGQRNRSVLRSTCRCEGFVHCAI